VRRPRAESQRPSAGAPRGSGNTSARQVAPGPVTDLLSAVQEVQWLEKQGERSKDDIPNLKRDVQIFDAVLNGKKVDDADGAGAHFYRAEGLRLINSVHEHEGEAVESSAAKRAIEDFNKVIAGGVNTYIAAVNVTNAEYFAGSVARNYLQKVTATFASGRRLRSKNSSCR
jgi:hypothetical protein